MNGARVWLSTAEEWVGWRIRRSPYSLSPHIFTIFPAFT